MNNKARFLWDKCGVGLSLACAIHCLLFPLLSMLAFVFPLLAPEFMPQVLSHWIQGWEKHDPYLWGLAFVLSLVSCVKAWRLGDRITVGWLMGAWVWFAWVEWIHWPHALVGLSAMGLVIGHTRVVMLNRFSCSAHKIC